MAENDTRRVIVSKSTIPSWNLAAEEYLFDTLPEGTRILFLYTNGPAVVIGKHQNPWLEVNIPELLEKQIPLLRRISGGGAVYHDEGNLNFSFLGPRNGFDKQGNLDLVRKALLSVGIRADIGGTADLWVNGKKTSGNAFCFRRERGLHHGTLLLKADLALLKGLLSPPVIPIETHAVRSKRAETMNLSSSHPGITRQSLVSALAKVFAGGAVDPEIVSSEDHTAPEIAGLAERNSSWEWNFGQTPDFTINMEGLTVMIRKGCIHSLEGDLSGSTASQMLSGLPFRRQSFLKVLECTSGGVRSAIEALWALSV